jgi:hypothetical protein
MRAVCARRAAAGLGSPSVLARWIADLFGRSYRDSCRGLRNLAGPITDRGPLELYPTWLLAGIDVMPIVRVAPLVIQLVDVLAEIAYRLVQTVYDIQWHARLIEGFLGGLECCFSCFVPGYSIYDSAFGVTLRDESGGASSFSDAEAWLVERARL